MATKPAPFDKDEVVVKNRLRPKDAATLVLVRREKNSLRVLMGQRHGNMAFMANKFVFPGGRVDPGDQRILIGGNLPSHATERLTKDAMAQRARGFAVGSMREACQEGGIRIG